MSEKIDDGRMVLLAKMSGKTSFDTLWDVKHALGTKKIGHTGTLDSFADGLLVVLSGTMTRLVDYITALDKEYRAVFVFGSSTDTLDPSGSVTVTAPLPREDVFRRSVAQFTGRILQRPPLFSAVHVDGRRASDCVRSGRSVDIPPRPVTVSEFEVVSVTTDASGGVLRAEVRIVCSKGTYIRSLARDVGEACGSAAFVQHLRRTRVGCYSLDAASLACYLPPFGSGAESVLPPRPVVQSLIRDSAVMFSPQSAADANLPAVFLRSRSAACSFMQGKVIDYQWFLDASGAVPVFDGNGPCAVFDTDGALRGMIRCTDGRLSYGFVVPGGCR